MLKSWMQTCVLDTNSPDAKVSSPLESLVFDLRHELLWTGSHRGIVTAIEHPTCQRTVRFRASVDPVVSIFPTRHTVTSVSNNTINTHNRGGMLLDRWSVDKFGKITAAMKLKGQHDPSMVIGGAGEEVASIDSRRSSVVSRHACKPHTTVIAKNGNLLVCGKASGEVELFDAFTLKPAGEAISAHPNRVLDIAVKDNLVVTCGQAPPGSGFRRGKPMLDVFVRVYDIRTMRLLRPISCKGGAIKLQFMPRFTSSFMIVSPNGKLAIADANAGPADYPAFLQIQTASTLVGCACSATGELLAFGDEDGVLSVLADNETAIVNYNSTALDPPPSFPNDHIALNIGADRAISNPRAHPASTYKDEFLPFSSITPFPSKRESLNSIEEQQRKSDSDWKNNNNSSYYYQRRGARRLRGRKMALSEWETHYGDISLYPMAPVDPSLVPELSMRDTIGTAPYPSQDSAFVRNCTASLMKYTATSSDSDKFRRSAASHRSFIMRNRRFRVEIPSRYARVKIKIPRFGLHTFNFSSYNKTEWPGLLNLLPNSYVVEFLQILYHLPPIRAHVMNHLCMKELCITCELGFLFHMMNNSKGGTAEPRNLLRTLRQIKEASALGLLEGTESSRDTRLSVRIQGFCRFLLQHLSNENASTPAGLGGDDMVRHLFEFAWQRQRHCLQGKHSKVDRKSGMTVKMQYPRVRKKVSFEELLESGINSEDTQRVWCESCSTYRITKKESSMESFPLILCIQADINSEADLDLWRTPPEKPAEVEDSEKLNVHDASDNRKTDNTPSEEGESPAKNAGRDHKSSNSNSNSNSNNSTVNKSLRYWVPERIRLESRKGMKKGRCCVVRENAGSDTGEEVKANNNRKEPMPNFSTTSAHYELVAVISHISDPPDTDSELNVYNAEHLTAHIAIVEGEDPADASHFGLDTKSNYGRHADARMKRKKKWFLFNGFVITESSLEDALEFAKYPWKEPCILLYERHDLHRLVSVPEYTEPILRHGLGAFLRPESLSSRSVVRMRTFAPLRPHEIISPQVKVAIDCEFVAVEKEETRINKATGKKIVVKPMRHSLARISLLRASGPEAGKPLLDDYIVGSEPVVDYLTRYSGIEPGDLDRSISTRHLVTLKSAYVRLRYLADQGVTFIGHGLKSDFMLINIVVPKNQIIDTVDLYHIPGRRKLSLRFLAAHVLKLDIQGVTHDSIEDARTAMSLYYRYQQLVNDGIFEKSLAHLYDIGNSIGFKA